MNRNIVRLSILGLALLIPLVANGYTLILRDGRRLEIPDTFRVDRSTLTYEAGPGIQITLRLEVLDVLATEKINGETAGSLKRRSSTKDPTTARQRTHTAGTVTNLDLERFRQARLAGELAYEQRRKELGLPSAEESRQAILSSGERAQTQLLQIRSDEQQSENYWRSQASELRTELSATNERINFVQRRLNELPLNYSTGAFTSILPLQAPHQFGGARTFPPTVFPNPFPLGPRAVLGGSIRFGAGRSRGQILMNPVPRRGFGRRSHPHPFAFGSLIALPFDTYDSSFERIALLDELDFLLSHRAGLQARWRNLEEEARKRGAYPGWLR